MAILLAGRWAFVLTALAVGDGDGAESKSTRPTITLGEKVEAIDPSWRGAGLVDLEKIEVEARRGTLTATLSGAAYAHSYLGKHSAGATTMHLVQPFAIDPGESKGGMVVLALSAKLDGYVRSVPQGAATLRRAGAAVYAAGGGPVAWLAFPAAATVDEGARRCKSSFDAPKVTLPAGRYVLVADLALDTTVEGICRGHAEAVFAPLVRRGTWDLEAGPFAKVDSEDFGLTVTAAVSAPPERDADGSK
ncbi:MAG TPA: hypothetical protein VG406_17715 [Isosphaeraceae bacterium]|jgi:hypothetical protein|nr:hypothetical protein [Isosphaeraceae bacterium]